MRLRDCDILKFGLWHAKISIARVSVQFKSVIERLTPHDTVFAFSKASELQDSAMSSACSLHTATSSIKSSSDSLPQRNLAGITEDASESRVEDMVERRGAVDFERGSLPRQISGDSQTRLERVNGTASADLTPNRSTSIKTQRSPQRPRTTSNVDKALPPTPEDLERQKTQKPAPTSVLEYGDYEARPSVERRKSSQSTRPSARDLYDAYGYKQKVKYGPRPSIDSIGRSDNMDRSSEFRPVATLPAGLRMPPRKSVPAQKTGPVQARPQSQQSQRTFPGSLSSQETLRAAPVTPIHIPDPKLSIVSNGLPTPAKTPTETSSSKITPEKRRLMKALQLRQKQLAAQQPANDHIDQDKPAEATYIKAEVDNSSLDSIVETSNSEADSDAVNAVVKDLSKEDSRNLEASPISLPETSEGHSTQASSITDGEDIAALKEQERNGAGEGLPSESDGIPLDHHNEVAIYQAVGSQQSATMQKSHGIDESIKSLANSDLRDKTGIDGSAQQNLGEVWEATKGQGPLEGEARQQEAKCDPLARGARDTAAILPLAIEKEALTKDVNRDSGNTLIALSVTSSPGDSGVSTNMAGGEKRFSDNKALETISKETLAVHSKTVEAAAPQNITLAASALPTESDVPSSDAVATKVALPDGHAVSNRALSASIDYINPQEVPLPPIDEDEIISLNPFGAQSQTQSASQPSGTGSESHSTLSREKSHSQGSALSVIRPSTSDSISGQHPDRQIRRHGVVNLPKRVSSPEHSDEHFLSDDSFMEELKFATVQEAKPISVSKSPIKPVFSRSESEHRLVDATRASRSVSSPLNQASKDDEVFSSTRLPTSSPSRSFSASHSLRPDNQQAPPMPKKIGVSSGISQRIKALEQLSSRPTSPQSGSPSNASQFITLRKISVRTPPGTSDSTNKLTYKSRPTTGYPSPSPSPETLKLNPFNNLTKSNYSRPESVSVTATIVRDANIQSPEAPQNPSEPRALELHQSPLVVEHQKMAPPPLSPLKPPRPRYARYSSARSGSSSSTEQKLDAPPAARRDSFASMRSRSSRASEVDLPPRSLSDTSLLSGVSSLDDIKEEKKDSKRSRLIKRMSSISIMSRRSIAHALSPSPKEAPIMEHQEPIAEILSTVIDVGDVNIQFPDNLVGWKYRRYLETIKLTAIQLWKRRRMVIDEKGVLVLSASKSDNVC